MSSFGEKLVRERENQNMTIEEIAAATGIQLAYLEALEGNQFHALPGPAFGKLYIRAYAEVLGFDPRPLIEDYDREQRAALGPSTEKRSGAPRAPRRVAAVLARWRADKMAEREKTPRGVAAGEAAVRDPEPLEPAEVEPVLSEPVLPAHHEEATAPESASEASVHVPERGPRSRRSVVVALLLLGVFLVVAGTQLPFFRTDEEEQISSAPAPLPSSLPSVEADPPAVLPAPEPVPSPTTVPGRLSVREFGVGRRMANQRVVGEEERFAEGDVAWFSTHVLGGKRGERVRHVWIHEGSAGETVALALGGPRWRTYSSKRLRRTGSWAVEARDEAGRVLARATFTCEPR